MVVSKKSLKSPFVQAAFSLKHCLLGQMSLVMLSRYAFTDTNIVYWYPTDTGMDMDTDMLWRTQSGLIQEQILILIFV